MINLFCEIFFTIIKFNFVHAFKTAASNLISLWFYESLILKDHFFWNWEYCPLILHCYTELFSSSALLKRFYNIIDHWFRENYDNLSRDAMIIFFFLTLFRLGYLGLGRFTDLHHFKTQYFLNHGGSCLVTMQN